MRRRKVFNLMVLVLLVGGAGELFAAEIATIIHGRVGTGRLRAFAKGTTRSFR